MSTTRINMFQWSPPVVGGVRQEIAGDTTIVVEFQWSPPVVGGVSSKSGNVSWMCRYGFNGVRPLWAESGLADFGPCDLRRYTGLRAGHQKPCRRLAGRGRKHTETCPDLGASGHAQLCRHLAARSVHVRRSAGRSQVAAGAGRGRASRRGLSPGRGRSGPRCRMRGS
jgi:hypothetical protein